MLRKILICIIAKSGYKFYSDKWNKRYRMNQIEIFKYIIRRLQISISNVWESKVGDLRPWLARWELCVRHRLDGRRGILCREWCGQVAIYGWHLCELALAFFFRPRAAAAISTNCVTFLRRYLREHVRTASRLLIVLARRISLRAKSYCVQFRGDDLFYERATTRLSALCESNNWV